LVSENPLITSKNSLAPQPSEHVCFLGVLFPADFHRLQDGSQSFLWLLVHTATLLFRKIASRASGSCL
jgi:hypothetical protein